MHQLPVDAQRPVGLVAVIAPAEPAVRRQLLRRVRRAVARQIVGRRDDRLAGAPQRPRHQVGRRQLAPPDRDVGPLVHQVDHAVGQPEVDAQVGVALQQARQQRDQHLLPERHAGVDADPPARRRARRSAALGFVQVGQHAHAALVELAAFGAQLQLAGRPVHQLNAQPRLQPRDQLAHRRRRHAQRTRCGREAAALDHLHEGFHFAGAVDVDAGHC